MTPPAASPATHRAARPRGRRTLVAALGAVALLAGAGVAVAVTTAGGDRSGAAPTVASPAVPTAADRTATGTAEESVLADLDAGPGGFVVQDSPASRWVEAHPDDPRASLVADRIASQPAALWLTGENSFGNLEQAVARARAADGTLTLSLYDIPGRDDGLTSPSTVSGDEYRSFVDRVVTTIGSTRAVVVVEPDALWFVDRQTPPGSAAYTQRIELLHHVVDAFAAGAPRTRVYLEAGTSSNSVTAPRMAQLLQAAGVAHAAGFAVNVSSFGPDAQITAWAQGIRAGLAELGVPGARYVVDTGRNGNPEWDFTWCNPGGREIGAAPAVVGAADGLDATLWIKQPGTSDGSCGVGTGSSGGEFLPQVAVDMLG